jgi:hypothetical protein
MNGTTPSFAVLPEGQTDRSAGARPPGRSYQELWFTVAPRRWASLVIVPVDGASEASKIAIALADVGSRLSEAPVTAIVAQELDFASARALTSLQPRIENDGGADVVGLAGRGASASPGGPSSGPRVVPAPARAIIAVRPVVDEVLGLAVAQSADAILLCLTLGRSRLPAVRRTLELVGRERVLGTVVLR